MAAIIRVSCGLGAVTKARDRLRAGHHSYDVSRSQARMKARSAIEVAEMTQYRSTAQAENRRSAVSFDAHK